MSDIRYKTSTQIAGISAIHRSLSHNQNTDITVILYRDGRFMTNTQMLEWSPVSRYQRHYQFTYFRYQNQNQYTDTSVITNTQKSESSPVHRYQSHYLYKDIKMITSVQMSETSPVHRCQISDSKPVLRFQGYHQYTEVRVITST